MEEMRVVFNDGADDELAVELAPGTVTLVAGSDASANTAVLMAIASEATRRRRNVAMVTTSREIINSDPLSRLEDLSGGITPESVEILMSDGNLASTLGFMLEKTEPKDILLLDGFDLPDGDLPHVKSDDPAVVIHVNGKVENAPANCAVLHVENVGGLELTYQNHGTVVHLRDACYAR